MQAPLKVSPKERESLAYEEHGLLATDLTWSRIPYNNKKVCSVKFNYEGETVLKLSYQLV